MTNKERYRLFCKQELDIPIFSKDWWMDAVCGEENWDVLLAKRNDEIIASMPYHVHKKSILKYISQPKLTQTNGIWIKYPQNQKYSSRLDYEKKVMFDIIKQIESLNIDYFNQYFHHSITNWLPFYWNGFKQTTRYTYIIDKTKDLEGLYQSFSKSVRKNIKKAQDLLKIEYSEDIEEFYHINKMTFSRQNMPTPYSLDFIKRLDLACKSRGYRKIILAKDKDDNIHTAIYVVWDQNAMYLLMSGSNPNYRDSNAKNLLVWEALKIASELDLDFDFEGSMIESISDYNRSFGAHLKPYFSISKTNSKLLKLKETYKVLINKNK